MLSKSPLHLAIVLVLLSARTDPASSHTLVRPQEQKPPAVRVTEPEWERLPGPDDFSRLYPQLATLMHLGGQVLITCTVSERGELQHCGVDSEIPAGLGFGRAALLMAPSFKMKPQMVDGVPAAGATITVPIRFNVDYPETTDTDLFELLGAPSLASPAALSLGRQIVHVTNAVASRRQLYETLAQQSLATFEGKAPGAESQVLLSVIVEAYVVANEALDEARARKIAGTLTIPQMKKILDFAKSDVGVAWIAEIKLEGEVEALTGPAFQKYIGEDAGRRYCRRVKCVDDAAPPSQPLAGTPPKP